MAGVMSFDYSDNAASRRFAALMSSPELDTYPSPMHLVASDNPRLDEIATEALLEGDAVLLVHDDGRELLITPEASGGARLETRHPAKQPITA